MIAFLYIKNIFHIALNDYDPARENDSKRVFKNTIRSLLDSAEKCECKSVAFPAFGTGILKYPRDKVAKWMITSINNYFSKNNHTLKFLNNVVIVLFEKDLETIRENIYNLENKTPDASLLDEKDENESDSLKSLENSFYSGCNHKSNKFKLSIRWQCFKSNNDCRW